MILTEHTDFWSRIRFAAEWHRLTGDLVLLLLLTSALMGAHLYRVVKAGESVHMRCLDAGFHVERHANWITGMWTSVCVPNSDR